MEWVVGARAGERHGGLTEEGQRLRKRARRAQVMEPPEGRVRQGLEGGSGRRRCMSTG